MQIATFSGEYEFDPKLYDKDVLCRRHVPVYVLVCYYNTMAFLLLGVLSPAQCSCWQTQSGSSSAIVSPSSCFLSPPPRLYLTS